MILKVLQSFSGALPGTLIVYLGARLFSPWGKYTIMKHYYLMPDGSVKDFYISPHRTMGFFEELL